MYVKALGSPCKHTRSRPLRGPQPHLRQNAFIPPYKFAKKPTLPLRVNLSRENFNAWNPGFFNFFLAPIRGGQFAGIHASSGKFLSKRSRAIILRVERASHTRVDTLPKIFFVPAHSVEPVLLA
jgi:hypothetical protein